MFSINHITHNIMEYPSISVFDPENIQLISLLSKEINCKWFIQEKIDGSQMSFRSVNSEIEFTNKKNKIHRDSKLFRNTTRAIMHLSKKVSFNPNLTYHGESLHSNCHNIMVYQRIPRHYFMCFDIYDASNERYLNPDEIKIECDRVNIEYVGELYTNQLKSVDPSIKLQELLDQIQVGSIPSKLGNLCEGIVLKHNNVIDDKGNASTLKKKYVIAEFQERRKSTIDKSLNYFKFLESLGKLFATSARYHKAIIHLREKDMTFNQQDLEVELDNDFDKEYIDEIKEYLWQHVGEKIKEVSRQNLSEWIKHKSNATTIAPDKPSIETINEESCRFLVDQFGKYYDRNDRYSTTYRDLADGNKLDGTRNDIKKMEYDLDHRFDDQYKNELIEHLWTIFSPIIKAFARHDFSYP